MIRFAPPSLVAAAVMGLSGSAWAGPNLLVNGGFETETGQTTAYSEQLNASALNYTSGVTLDGWSNAGYNFVFVPGAGTSGTTADTTGSRSAALKLYGPGNGYANGLTNSPTGGNFIAADGAYQTGALSQTVNNLTVGYSYFLSFYWAAAQQTGFSGGTTEAWQVSFTDARNNVASFSTPTVSTAFAGFSPWRLQTYTFTATTTSETLSFLAAGTPGGQPPFSLLDGVSLVVPEPGTWSLVIAGLAAALVLCRMRRPVAARRHAA